MDNQFASRLKHSVVIVVPASAIVPSVILSFLLSHCDSFVEFSRERISVSLRSLLRFWKYLKVFEMSLQMRTSFESFLLVVRAVVI